MRCAIMKPKAMVRLTGGTLLVVAGLAVWPVSTTTETVGTESDLLIINGTLVDGTGAEPIRDGRVRVRGDRIYAVGGSRDLMIPRGVQLIDARGGTIMPGIINSHVHHAASAEQRRRFLEEGVTTVCDLGTPLAELPQFDERGVEGHPVARGFFAGPILTAPGGYPDGLYGTTGFNYEVATLAPFFNDRFPQYDALLHRMAEEGIVMVPTVSALLRDHPKPELTQREQYVSDVILDIVRRFREAGGIVAIGNDFNDRSIEERLPLIEMRALRDAGLTPMEVIEAGTRLAARVCGQEDDIGTLEVGKLADIIVVEGDPLVDLDALSSPSTIVVGGEVLR
jgi:imidazolonepropionase-like amidohydrolase